jgi:hypothetical protein
VLFALISIGLASALSVYTGATSQAHNFTEIEKEIKLKEGSMMFE